MNPLALANKIDDAIKFETFDYAIQGKGLKLFLTLSDSDVMLAESDPEFKKHIKEKLAAALAEKILESNLCEFTQWSDALTMTRSVGVRCYLVPNDHVKILRTHHANLHR